MREFLKPTRVTWIIFAILLATNAGLIVLGFLTFTWSLIGILLFQIGWLYASFNFLNIDVMGKSSEFITAPNLLGWMLVIIGSLISLALYYFISSYISKNYYDYKNRKMSR